LDSRKQNKGKKRHANPAVSRKIEKTNTAVAGVERRRMQRFESQVLAKSNRVGAKRPKEKGPQPGYPELLAKVTLM
jgi:hypothetical protein